MRDIDISQYLGHLALWSGQWETICSELREYKDSTPKFEDIIKNTNSSFGHVIQQVIFDNLNQIEAQQSKIRYLKRFVMESDIKKITESRFIPQPEYAALNRMNDKDRLYSYFSISYLDSAYNDVTTTGLKELRAKLQDDVWGCNFELLPQIPELKIIDLSCQCKIPKDEDEYSRFLERKIIQNRTVNKSKLSYWLIQTILQIMQDSDMFNPIDKEMTENVQRYFYKPFHVICDYLERNNYSGVIYRSTVFKKGRCLTLFNTNYAKCLFETCEKIDVKRYLKK